MLICVGYILANALFAIAYISGLDETVGQNIYAHHTFAAKDILWNMRFVDILAWTSKGDRYIDYSHFHDVTPL